LLYITYTVGRISLEYVLRKHSPNVLSYIIVANWCILVPRLPRTLGPTEYIVGTRSTVLKPSARPTVGPRSIVGLGPDESESSGT